MINSTNISEVAKLKRFDVIFKKYYTELKVFVNSYIQDSDESVDIVQNSFIKLWERGDLDQEMFIIRSFLYTIAKNYSLDALKHRKIKQNFIENAISDNKILEQELIEEALRSFNDYEYDNKSIRDKIKMIILKLPYNDRKIFILSKYRNLTHNEIAELLHISPKTVEKKLRLAFTFLKHHFIFIF